MQKHHFKLTEHDSEHEISARCAQTELFSLLYKGEEEKYLLSLLVLPFKVIHLHQLTQAEIVHASLCACRRRTLRFSQAEV